MCQTLTSVPEREKMSDSDEESAEVEEKQTDDNYHLAINAVNH